MASEIPRRLGGRGPNCIGALSPFQPGHVSHRILERRTRRPFPMRTLPLAALLLASFANSIAAQCQPGAAAQRLATVYSGTMFEGSATPPSYGVSIDPGVGIRFDLASDAPIEIEAIGLNLLVDGGNYGMPVPNLIGAPNGTLEVWVAQGRSVTEAALFANVQYRHLPPTPPPQPWRLLSDAASHVANLAFAEPDSPSLATFSPPLSLPAGNHAIVLVAVPRGLASIPAGTGTAPNALTDRIHPLFTNLQQVPGPTSYTDRTLTITNPGIQNPAFATTARSPLSTPPVMPNFELRYRLGANSAFQTGYGLGCYDRKQTFYESFLAAGTTGGATIDLAPGSVALRKLGARYLVEVGASTYPRGGAQPGSTSWYRLNHPATPTHVNTRAPATTIWGDWDDATSAAYPLPFAFSFPGDGGSPATHLVIGSNGAIWLRNAQPSSPRFGGDYQNWLAGPPSFAPAFFDLYPADRYGFLGGSGEIYIDSDGANYVTVSWVGVTEYPSGAATGTINSFQATLQSSGDVEFTYGRIRHGVSDVLVGFTPGNGASDPGTGATPRRAPDIRNGIATGGFYSGDGARPALLQLANRPKVGSPLAFETSNLDATAAINVTLVSAGRTPGIDLRTLGMAGCSVHIALPEIASFAQLNIGGHASWPALASIPAAFAGYDLFAQSVQLCTGQGVSYNAANILTSNGVCFRFERN